jgi:hypothetical protein
MFASDKNADLANTALNQKHSPLLHLPAELRNQVYGYVFSNLVFQLAEAEHWDSPRPRDKRSDDALVLTATCHQVRQEAKLLPFVHASFNTEPVTSKIQAAIRVAFSLEQCDAIRNVKIRLNEFNYYCGNSTMDEAARDASLQELLRPIFDVQIRDFSFFSGIATLLKNAVAKMEGVSIEIVDRGVTPSPLTAW